MARKRRRRSKEDGTKFLYRMKKKLVVLFIFVLLAFAGLGARLSYITQKDGENYKKQILSQQAYDSKTLPYKRGEILDASGTKLAYSEKVYNLVIDAYAITHSQAKHAKEDSIWALGQYFGLNTAEVTKHIEENPDNRYFVAKKTLTYDEVEPFLQATNAKYKKEKEEEKEANEALEEEKEQESFKDKVVTKLAGAFKKKEKTQEEGVAEAEDPNREKDITGIWFEEEYRRQYPYNSLGSTVIGFIGSDNNGNCGLEKFYDDTLNGTNGRQYGYLNEDSNLERSTRPAKDGQTLVTSIDVNIQSVVEKYIKEFNDLHKGEYRPEDDGSSNTAVIVMNPQNGEVMAMADYPSFDLNNPTDLTPFYSADEIAAMDETAMYEHLEKIWRNFCISDTYEPGSVSKSMTIAAGLDCGKLTGNESYFCGGVMEVSKHKIKCHKHSGHGMVTVSQALEQSCNMALIQIAEQMGKDNLMKYLYNFNIGLKTNIDLSGEARTASLVFKPENMVASDLAISSFGQGYNVTMIQMASAFSSIINGGKYYEPHLVKEIKNADGTTVKKVEPRMLKQTISATTSDQMRQYLANVCLLGTGKTAVPAGYVIGGKTGTAEKQPRGNGQYVVSFMGFAPVDDPQVVVYAVVDEPNVADQPHSTFSQEIVKNIMTEILPYLHIYRTEELTEEEREILSNMNLLSNSENALSSEDGEGEDGENAEGEEGDTEGAEGEEGVGDNPEGVNPDTGLPNDLETTYEMDPNTGEINYNPEYDPSSDDDSGSDLDGLNGVENVYQNENDFSAGAGF